MPWAGRARKVRALQPPSPTAKNLLPLVPKLFKPFELFEALIRVPGGDQIHATGRGQLRVIGVYWSV